MSPPETATAQQERDERLARLLEELTRQKRSGVRPDLDGIILQHPDLADELRHLVNLAGIADVFVRPVPAVHSTARKAEPVPSGASPTSTLPQSFDGYELREELGRGAMGVVYKAWEPSLERYVALKMVLRGEQASAAELGRFRAEAQAVARLSHPNIVPVHRVGHCEGRDYFCMEFVEGQSLSLLTTSGPLSPERAARYLAAMSRAVHHAHQNGILHRDLKPANVLIDLQDQPRVTDFGLAKRVEGGADFTGTGAIVGTPSYMAPEQAAGGEGRIGPPADVYALGAILYELLTGRPPFQAASVWDVLMMVRTEEPIRPRLLNRKTPQDLELICLKCLEKRPEHRYPSALALAEDLERFLQSEPVAARTSSLAYFVNRLFRETHHAPVMENWGGLWMIHSLKLFLLCAVTNWMYWAGVGTGPGPVDIHEGFRRHLPYLLLWGVGLVAWGCFFWAWRRRGGPVTFVERQVAHAWGAGVAASIGTLVVEVLLGLPVLTLSPVLAIAAGMVFTMKAGTLTGWFYVAAALCFVTAIPMALFPQIGPLLFGLVSAVGFFVPGLKYYRQRRRAA
jgi:serine/threonine-protein kinase